jgi:hypothetical protein
MIGARTVFAGLKNGTKREYFALSGYKQPKIEQNQFHLLLIKQ